MGVDDELLRVLRMFTESATSQDDDCAGAPDRRKWIITRHVAPTLAQIGLPHALNTPESAEIFAGLALACCDTWSMIRQEARTACSAAVAECSRNCGDELATGSAVAQLIDALRVRASRSGAAWYEVEGSIKACSSIAVSVVSEPKSIIIQTVTPSLGRFACDVALGACRHEQQPVRDAAVAFMTQPLVKPQVEPALGPLVHSFLSQSPSSASTQGALALGVEFAAARDALAPFLIGLAASPDAAVRQLVSVNLSSGSLDDTAAADFATMAVTLVTRTDLAERWTAVETGLLAIETLCCRALKNANLYQTDALQSPGGTVPGGENKPFIALSVAQRESSSEAVLRPLKRQELLGRLTQLTYSTQFEVRRMSHQLLPLLVQLHVRHLPLRQPDEPDALLEELLVALVEPNCAPFAGRFAVFRAVLEAIAAARKPVVGPESPLARLIATASQRSTTVEVLARIYSSFGLFAVDSGTFREWSSRPLELCCEDQWVAWAAIDVSRMDPLLAIRCGVPGIVKGLGEAPVHCQSAALAALDVLLLQASDCNPSTQETSVQRQRAQSVTHYNSIESFTGIRTRHALFAFVTHTDFAAPELLDGGSDVATGIAWLRTADRVVPSHLVPTAFTPIYEVTEAIFRDRTLFDTAFASVDDLMLSKASDPRVVSRARHLYRSAFRCGLRSATSIISVIVARLRHVTPHWGDFVTRTHQQQSSAADEPDVTDGRTAVASGGDWDDESNDEDEASDADQGSFAISVADEVASAARLALYVGLDNTNGDSFVLPAGPSSDEMQLLLLAVSMPTLVPDRSPPKRPR